ncbi:MAG: 2-amino-4-hydroxy-6-hydroxymethyldihydropteridine diphosphokinase [Tatlockia sp.]|nr:2-amino-4-hydroxy-6-hydroxymethyldihydropteridine diphosphokinase [Tatlockia sp.]
MTLCYLGLGSNLNSPERQLRMALNALRLLPQTNIKKIAPIYRSEALGRKAQPRFLNTVVAINTSLTPELLLRYCQKIEREQGRIRKVQNGARTLDIDILFYGEQKISDQNLQIPHPRMLERDFVLKPLSEIAGAEPLLPLPFTLNYIEVFNQARESCTPLSYIRQT